MNRTRCADCLHAAPLICLLPGFLKSLWSGVARLWRSALADLGQLG